MEPDWDKATDLILSFEAFRPYVYDDAYPNRPYKGGTVVGTLTIGYGTTAPSIVQAYLSSGQQMLPEEAYRIYKEQVPGYWDAIKKHIKVDVNPNQAAALTSLSYNSGGDGIARYAPLLLQAINDRQFTTASELWKTSIIMVGSDFEQGLRNRRAAEAALFSLPYKVAGPSRKAKGMFIFYNNKNNGMVYDGNRQKGDRVKDISSDDKDKLKAGSVPEIPGALSEDFISWLRN